MNTDTLPPAPKSPEPAGAETAQVFRNQLQAHNTHLIDRFQSGESAGHLIRERSDFIDHLLSQAWRHFMSAHTGQAALIAVGGYGRRELHPYSDIDILLLIEPDDSAFSFCDSPLDEAISNFLGFLWDIGLKPAQSVRTLQECVEQAQQDQTVMTNLMESRLIMGAPPLYDHLWAAIAPDRIWTPTEFFAAKTAEQALRYAKYHDTAYNLEPNIKEGPGGLRDIQTINWIMKRYYNRQDVHLVQKGWLTEDEYAELLKARDFLWEIRFALHIITGRCEDRLLFEYQQQLPRQFGVRDSNVTKAVEQFMQLYYRTVMGLERLNELIMQLFEENALNADQATDDREIDECFHSIGSYVEARHPDVFREQPLALLRIFLLLQIQPGLKGIRASTIRLIRQHLYLIDEAFRADPDACKLFMSILRQRNGVTKQLRRMNRFGVLAAYLPAFARVVGRMQYDLFHVYTVDEHTLFVVRNLRRFSLEQHKSDHTLGNQVFATLAKPELLYVAGLMHDIAKGRGGDHSTLGALIAGEFCQLHGFTSQETTLVRWLVQHHLLMSMTAQRKDISDPEVIHEFATIVGDQNTLDHLYLLTVADIRATNPTLWNSWKDALLKELYRLTRTYFRRGQARPQAQAEKIASVKAESLNLLKRLGVPERVVSEIWQNTLNDEYFMRYHPDEAVWHTIALGACSPGDLPLVLLRPDAPRGSAEIFVYTQDRDHIFAQTTAVLDQLNLTIFDARIITAANGHVLNSYHVMDHSGEPINDLLRQTQICASLRERLLNQATVPGRVQRRESRQLRHFTVPTQVYFHEDAQQRHTLIELITTDRPGLLSKVGQAFALCGIRLTNARISTIGSRAEDLFHVTTQDGQPLTSENQQRKLEETILRLVGTN